MSKPRTPLREIPFPLLSVAMGVGGPLYILGVFSYHGEITPEQHFLNVILLVTFWILLALIDYRQWYYSEPTDGEKHGHADGPGK